MSVYTTVAHDELARWLVPLGTGPLEGFAGIAAGMQNSNYFVSVGGTRRVLTIFESLAPGELDFYLALQDHLAAVSYTHLDVYKRQVWTYFSSFPAISSQP